MLASAGRSSDLGTLDLKTITAQENSIIFKLNPLKKSRRNGQCPIKLTITTLETNPLLCAISTTTCYLMK